MRKEITLLQERMRKYGIHMYLVPTGDEHQSEYVPEYYEFRAYLSGFTGSAGTLLVTEEKCLLWTDGRYFIQAEKQLENTGIILMRSGEKGVDTIEEYISSHIKEREVLGFNGTMFSLEQARRLVKAAENAGASVCDMDLSEEVWENHPAIAVGKIKSLGLDYTGREVKEKLEMIRTAMKKVGADMHIVSSLDDIAWIFNLRGRDIPYNPVFYSYAIISGESAALFVKYRAVDEELQITLQKEKVEVLDYFQFFEYLKNNCIGKKILLDPSRNSYRTYCLLKSNNEIIEKESPSILMKAIKTKTEVANLKASHESDGLIMTKFIYWIKKKMEEETPVTEYEAAEYLDHLRLLQEECLDLSFDTIAAYGENAAMCHYSPDKNNPVYLKKEGFLLVDSGGQYLNGTTDITRTIAVGTLTKEQKEHYTLVLQGHIRLSMARFPEGVCGANLDILARGPLWNRGLDFNHGTGHGVGYYLNVHEGPNNIHWNIQRKNAKSVPLKPGMLTSNEPGLYLQDQYGIRIENLMLTKAVKDLKTEGFLEFETVTKAPYEREAIIPEMLSEEELNWLNQYHQQLFELYSKSLTQAECNWLRGVTEPLLKAKKE